MTFANTGGGGGGGWGNHLKSCRECQSGFAHSLGFILGMAQFTNSAVLFNIVRKAYDPSLSPCPTTTLYILNNLSRIFSDGLCQIRLNVYC